MTDNDLFSVIEKLFVGTRFGELVDWLSEILASERGDVSFRKQLPTPDFEFEKLIDDSELTSKLRELKLDHFQSIKVLTEAGCISFSEYSGPVNRRMVLQRFVHIKRPVELLRPTIEGRPGFQARGLERFGKAVVESLWAASWFEAETGHPLPSSVEQWRELAQQLRISNKTTSSLQEQVIDVYRRLKRNSLASSTAPDSDLRIPFNKVIEKAKVLSGVIYKHFLAFRYAELHEGRHLTANQAWAYLDENPPEYESLFVKYKLPVKTTFGAYITRARNRLKKR